MVDVMVMVSKFLASGSVLIGLPRMPGNSLLVEVSQYWKKKKW